MWQERGYDLGDTDNWQTSNGGQKRFSVFR